MILLSPPLLGTPRESFPSRGSRLENPSASPCSFGLCFFFFYTPPGNFQVTSEGPIGNMDYSKDPFLKPSYIFCPLVCSMITHRLTSPLVKTSQYFPSVKTCSEVSSLSAWVSLQFQRNYSPIHIITAWHSLFPTSSAH